MTHSQPHGGRMRAVWMLLLVIPLVAACTGGGARPHSSPVPSPRGAASGASPTPATLPGDQASAIEGALSGGSAPSVEAVLDPAVRSAYAKSPTRLLPAGSSVRVASATMKVTGNLATVSAIVTTNGRPQAWTLLLSKVDGKWLIYGTRK